MVAQAAARKKSRYVHPSDPDKPTTISLSHPGIEATGVKGMVAVIQENASTFVNRRKVVACA